MVGKRIKRGSKNKFNYDLIKDGLVFVFSGFCDFLGGTDLIREKENII